MAVTKGKKRRPSEEELQNSDEHYDSNGFPPMWSYVGECQEVRDICLNCTLSSCSYDKDIYHGCAILASHGVPSVTHAIVTDRNKERFLK